ncbi:uncharacterized protein LAESUDRAFT_762923 [Laetiporus sulphureus 93-53]|uniref:Uncharacterized protein n=1 Tax=Laetiporus sulphureus 93-53 TaxID=1314785 RepID=A0A165C7X0_9APHY|nr:uncharacterized protein LAESUDRAFT_762923 [Laetiporus sulphureus 93-53]KZT02355.1 hypothetical protein LAESUDRAFT_762923 [Laetiporus sulphureus 93-53]
MAAKRGNAIRAERSRQNEQYYELSDGDGGYARAVFGGDSVGSRPASTAAMIYRRDSTPASIAPDDAIEIVRRHAAFQGENVAAETTRRNVFPSHPRRIWFSPEAVPPTRPPCILPPALPCRNKDTAWNLATLAGFSHPPILLQLPRTLLRITSDSPAPLLVTPDSAEQSRFRLSVLKSTILTTSPKSNALNLAVLSLEFSPLELSAYLATTAQTALRPQHIL